MPGLLSNIQSTFKKLGGIFTDALDNVFPPEKRAEAWSRTQDFAIKNPKLAAFLATQFSLTGFPILLFLLFSISVFVFSLVTALIVALLAAVVFTLFMVGIALLVVLPTIFITTFTASFLFLWGIGGYYTLRWFNGGDSPAENETSVGNTVNNVTEGYTTQLTNGVHKKQDDAHADAYKAVKTYERYEKGTDGTANGKWNGKHNSTDQPNGVQKREGKIVDGPKNVADVEGNTLSDAS